MSNLLVKLIGFPATLIHGDTLVLDRWNWLRQRLPHTITQVKLLDVGCGSGAFTIGLAKRGYNTLGIDYSDEVINKAAERAALLHISNITFRKIDVRHLDAAPDLFNQFDVSICMENIEHILDDQKLMNDIAQCMKPNGKLYLSTPNYNFRPMTPYDHGPYSTIEDGGHVRKGYTPDDLTRLCEDSGLVVDKISYCSGFFSQKLTALQRSITGITNYPIAWIITLPMRILPPLLDPFIERFSNWPGYSICLQAHKPE